MHVIAGLEILVLSALRDILVVTRWTFSCVSPPTCPPALTAPGEALRPARGLVRPASSQRYPKTSKRRRARSLYVPKHEMLLSEGGVTNNCC